MTITEALILGRPLVAIRSTGMRPVQAGNERWLAESGAGLVVQPGELAGAVRVVLEDACYTERARWAYHRGVFAATERVRALVEAAEAVPATPGLAQASQLAP